MSPGRRRNTRQASESDGALAERIASGDEQAFALLLERHREGLARYCRRIGLHSAYVDDVVQQALVQLWITLRAGRTLLDVQAWLYRVTRNACLNELRRLNRDARPGESDAARSAVAREHDPERRLSVRETLADVAALPAMQREAVVLSGIEGRSHEEVAAMLGIENGAVRGLLYRARLALRAAAAAVMPTGLLRRIEDAAPRLRPLGARLAASVPTSPGAGSSLAAVTVAGALVASVTVGPLAGHPRPRTRAQRPRATSVAQVRVTPASARLDVPPAKAREGDGRHHPVGARGSSRVPVQTSTEPVVPAAPKPASRRTEVGPRPVEPAPAPSQSVIAAAAPAPVSRPQESQAGRAQEASQPAQAQTEAPTQAPPHEDGEPGEPRSDDGTDGAGRETDDREEGSQAPETQSAERSRQSGAADASAAPPAPSR